MDILNNQKYIPGVYGVAIALALIVYFFAMKIAGLAWITELRLLNLPIFVAGMYFAFERYRKMHKGRLDYYHAMLTGMAATFICSTIFAVFVFTYLMLNSAFMHTVMEHAPLGRYMNAYTAAFAIWFEGLFSGYMACFVLVNWKHTDKVEMG